MYEQRLLAIEDDEEIVRLVAQVALEAGYTARTVTDYRDIEDVYDSFKPQVIMLDIMMPGMDGIEVLNFLKSRNSKATIVILSGEGTYRQLAEKIGTAHGLNIVANLPKPFRVGALRLALQEIRHLITTEVA